MDPQQREPLPLPPDEDMQTVDSRYTDELVRRNAQFCETDLRPWYISHIDKQTASVQWKEGRRRLVMSAFDNSKVLAWLDSGREGSLTTFVSILKFRILVNLTHAADKPSDRKNPQLITFDDSLIYNYEHFISRASGMEERKQQGKISMQNETTQTIKQVMQGPEKKGIGGGLTGLLNR